MRILIQNTKCYGFRPRRIGNDKFGPLPLYRLTYVEALAGFFNDKSVDFDIARFNAALDLSARPVCTKFCNQTVKP